MSYPITSKARTSGEVIKEGVALKLLNTSWRMHDPAAVVSTIGAVVEILEVAGTAVDREKSRRSAHGARNCGGGVCDFDARHCCSRRASSFH